MTIIENIHKEYNNIMKIKRDFNQLILNEQFDLGSFTINDSGSAIISKPSKINSSIKGKVNNSLADSSCHNPVVIVSDDKKYYLQYCNLSKVNVKNRQNVNKNKIIGLGENGTEVTLYDEKNKKVKINSREAIRLYKGDNKEEYRKEKEEKSSEDPLVSGLFKIPFTLLKKPFENKYDKSGKLVQKRFGSPVSKKQVDPWILQSFKDPFGIKRRKESEKSNSNVDENIKLKENIDKILKLIKS
jgi:hypothetical protein